MITPQTKNDKGQDEPKDLFGFPPHDPWNNSLAFIPSVILDNHIKFIDPVQMLIVIHLSRAKTLGEVAEKVGMDLEEVKACMGIFIAKGLLEIKSVPGSSGWSLDFSGLTNACLEAEKQKRKLE